MYIINLGLRNDNIFLINTVNCYNNHINCLDILSKFVYTHEDFILDFILFS